MVSLPPRMDTLLTWFYARNIKVESFLSRGGACVFFPPSSRRTASKNDFCACVSTAARLLSGSCLLCTKTVETQRTRQLQFVLAFAFFSPCVLKACGFKTLPGFLDGSFHRSRWNWWKLPWKWWTVQLLVAVEAPATSVNRSFHDHIRSL